MTWFTARGWMELTVTGDRAVALVLPGGRSGFPEDWFVRSAVLARHWLQGLPRGQLLAICERLPASSPWDLRRMGDQDLRRRVDDALTYRQVEVVTAPRAEWQSHTLRLLTGQSAPLPTTTGSHRVIAAPSTATPADGPPATPAAPPRPTTFITIHLIDEQGKAIAGAACRVVVDDERVIATRFDANGKIDQHGLQTTTCRFTLPDLHRSRWSTTSGGGSETVVSQPRGDHAIAEGDSIAQVALPQGYSIDEVWNHAGNQALRERCGHPNQLVPGTTLALPPWQGRELLLPTGMVHVFTRHAQPLTTVALQVFAGDTACANLDWSFERDGQEPLSGVSDGDGVVELSLPADVASGVLTLGRKPPADQADTVGGPGSKDPQDPPSDLGVFDLLIDHLQPVGETAGVRQRLANLGFWWEIPDRSDDERLTAAVRSFQVRTGLDPSGAIDDRTRSRLVDLHDRRCPFPSEPGITHQA